MRAGCESGDTNDFARTLFLGVRSMEVLQELEATLSLITCHQCGFAAAHSHSHSPFRIIIFTPPVERVSFNPSAEYGVQMALGDVMLTKSWVDLEGLCRARMRVPGIVEFQIE